MTVTGETLGERLAGRTDAYVDRAIIAPRGKPLEPQGGLVALFGNLAPQGRDPEALGCGRETVRARRQGDRVLVARGPCRAHRRSRARRRRAGTFSCCKTPVRIRAAAMPEAGYLPIPKKLAAKGVKDMIRVSDARMSGTAFGTIVLHVTPDAASGGPLGLVRSGDRIRLSVKQRRIDLLVDEAELKTRAAARRPLRQKPPPRLCHALCPRDFGRGRGM